VDAASDDLTRPLGVDRAARRSRLPRLFGRRILAVTVASLAVAGGLVIAFKGDRWGGQPRAVVPIRTATAPSPAESRGAGQAPAPRGQRSGDAARQSAGEIETSSGVTIVRPQGSAAPGSIVIRIPDAAPARPPAGPDADARLLEQTSAGPLPRIAEDGSRPSQAYAKPAGSLPGDVAPRGRIAVIVGGLGLNPAATADAISRLPEAVTLAFAPIGADLVAEAARADAAGHELMLQVPMEPLDYPRTDPGPQTLTTGARPRDNLERLRWAMGRFTGYVGVTNFLGGKLTGDEPALTPILSEIGSRGLLFVDDGSSSRSVAPQVAASVQLPAMRADVVIDPVANADIVDRMLAKLEATALERGAAVGSASALPLTVERIERWARTLPSRGILLVPVSAVVGQRGTP
jgi:polysaccharide deacetylase 2 family uncharacterized protein YibQ